MVLANFMYQETKFYPNFFDESENGPFEVTPGRAWEYNKYEPDAPKFYFYRKNKIAYVLC